MESLPRVRQSDRASERNAVDFETHDKQLGGCLIRLKPHGQAESFPVVSQSSINVNERSAVRGSARGDG